MKALETASSDKVGKIKKLTEKSGGAAREMQLQTCQDEFVGGF